MHGIKGNSQGSASLALITGNYAGHLALDPGPGRTGQARPQGSAMAHATPSSAALLVTAASAAALVLVKANMK